MSYFSEIKQSVAAIKQNHYFSENAGVTLRVQVIFNPAGINVKYMSHFLPAKPFRKQSPLIIHKTSVFC
jgi:hypothetical protein